MQKAQFRVWNKLSYTYFITNYIIFNLNKLNTVFWCIKCRFVRAGAEWVTIFRYSKNKRTDRTETCAVCVELSNADIVNG